ncbi:argininosuccinate lyase [Kribbella orskensis]|uniref:argininosuccinate lyase n=1 Tax=Kribbella orskensis TaxID=2512216 RepID=A0ABY2BTB6_9ACTN|nr:MULTISPECIES: lyase family protein [Kribbella]TCN44715.1 argininosuccinate lyase [Kribbella sp. VKM Ac-2500]TCO31507.1 argininosuccinate lyase [Kribbella orskensis]
MTAVNTGRRVEGPSKDRPAQQLIDAGFAWEIADAPLLHHGLNLADIAHVLDLRHRRIIPERAAAALLGVLLEAYRTRPEDFPYDAAYGEPYNSRERHFVATIGDDAGWLHAGRPRREAARVALRILLRGLTAELAAGAAEFAATSSRTAARYREVFMPDQTYLQQAQPSTFGHYLLGFVPPAIRDCERLVAALAQLNSSPGGAGCVNGSRLLDDRRVIADLLGFDDVITHTRDAMWQTDTFIDVLATGVSLLSNQSKLAEDLEIWSSQEFDYVDLAGPYTRASVLMPQKRNPYALSIVRGAGGVLIGRLTGFLAVVKSPSARSDNLIFAYGEIPRAVEFATRITALMEGVVDTLTVNESRMWERLEEGFTQATDLAEFVMLRCGVDYRAAYLIVGEVVGAASRRGIRGVDISPEDLDVAAQRVIGRSLELEADEVRAVLDPRAIVATRSALGGAAPEAVDAMTEEYLAKAVDLGYRAKRELEKYAAAEARLIAEAEQVAGDQHR